MVRRRWSEWSGASPNSLAAGNKYAYVTNATNDNISVIDYRGA